MLAIVKEFVRHNPTVTFNELKATFKRNYLGQYAQFEFLESDIEKATSWKQLAENHAHHFVKDVITSGDGIPFVVCVEWDRNNIVPVLGIAKALGWKIDIIK